MDFADHDVRCDLGGGTRHLNPELGDKTHQGHDREKSATAHAVEATHQSPDRHAHPKLSQRWFLEVSNGQ